MSGENRPPLAIDTSIDRGIAALFRAIISHARGDALAVVAARSELVALAGVTEGFDARLVAAVAARLAPTCPNASRDDLERAVCTDVRRHVGSSLFLAELEPWGRA